MRMLEIFKNMFISIEYHTNITVENMLQRTNILLQLTAFNTILITIKHFILIIIIKTI